MSERANERSGARKRSEQCGASEQVSGMSERGDRRASGPVLQSVFLVILDHSASFRQSVCSVYFLTLSNSDEADFSYHDDVARGESSLDEEMAAMDSHQTRMNKDMRYQ